MSASGVVRLSAIFTLIVGVALAGVVGADEPPVQVRAAAQPAVTRIGEPITYRITVEHPRAVTIDWPAIGGELAGFSVEEVKTSRPLEHDRMVLEERAYRLRTFDVGDHHIPEPVVGFRVAAGEPGQARGPAMSVRVTSVLPEDWATQDIRGPKPLVALHPWRWWIIGGLVALAGIAAALWWMNRRRRACPPPPPRPAHEIALEALERLRQEWLPAKGRYEEYYVRLTGIVRTYLEGRFGLRAPKMTTEEFLQSLVQLAPASSPQLTGPAPGRAPAATGGVSVHQAGLASEQRHLLSEFLTHCDLVKFARYQPSPEEASRAFASAQRLVEQTKPREEATAAGAASAASGGSGPGNFGF